MFFHAPSCGALRSYLPNCGGSASVLGSEPLGDRNVQVLDKCAATETGAAARAIAEAVAWLAWGQGGGRVSILSLARTVAAATDRGITPIRNCREAKAAATNLAGATVSVCSTGNTWVCFTLSARASLASPKHASAMPAKPTPNFFSAERRVTDWAKLLVSSSNWLFTLFSFRFGFVLHKFGRRFPTAKFTLTSSSLVPQKALGPSVAAAVPVAELYCTPPATALVVAVAC
jgi:hypothetical protein